MDKETMKIDRCYGKDFGLWKMQIEDLLYQKNLHQPLSREKPYSMKQENGQALGVIRLTLVRNVAFNIANETTMAELMRALSNMYKKPYVSNKVYLMVVFSI